MNKRHIVEAYAELEKENAELKARLFNVHLSERASTAKHMIESKDVEIEQLKARLAHVESELEKEREVVEFYAEGELSSDLEIRPDKKELWLIPEKWAQRIMSDHYMGKRARQRIKERKEFKYDNNRCH